MHRPPGPPSLRTFRILGSASLCNRRVHRFCYLRGHTRLPRDAFHIDPGLKESIEAETEARLEETKAELAWASEKAALGLQKMEETFLTSSAVEAMELKALGDAQLKVSSFRTTELADW